MTHVLWRLLNAGFSDGPTNMAIDQAIMEAVAAGHVPPTLRFYGWEPACLSLGYTQPVADVDRIRLERCGWDLVRRMTGGRAILHTDELTYSVALPGDDPLVRGDIVASYRHLSAALRDALEHLGAAVESERRMERTPGAKGPVCFEVPSHYEITAGGKKLIGSAQVRKFGAVLQHGSIPLTGDIARICEALVFESEEQRARARDQVRRRATTVEAALGRVVTWDEARGAIAEGFARVFNLDLVAGELTPEETGRAALLRAEQYDAEAWHARF